MVLKVVKEPNPVLRKRCAEVSLPLSKDDQNLLAAMLEYVKKSQDKTYADHHQIREGVGVAAPQVGVAKRMTAISYPKGEGRVEYALVNPKILSSSVKLTALAQGEGCLSVDQDHPGYVYRSSKIVVEAYDMLQGKTVTITAFDYDAIVLQHEIDHLNGVLYYDRIARDDPFKVLPNSALIE